MSDEPLNSGHDPQADHIHELEVQVGRLELQIERLNTDRIEQRRRAERAEAQLRTNAYTRFLQECVTP